MTVRIDHSGAANDKLTVNGLGGADTITGGPDLAALIQLVINGGTEVDVLTGGDGPDRIVGQQANDSMFGGAGDDTLVWNPGDGSDLLEGQAGTDAMEFNGAGGAENFVVSAVGSRVEFLRNLGNIDMDLDDVERIDLDALGGPDATTVNDLSATDMEDVNVDLEAVIGGGAADGVADTVTVNATNGVDIIDVAAVAGETQLTGLAASVRIAHADPRSTS